MKKTYGKPMVSFESFALSSSIAAGCSDLNGMHSEGSCPVYGTFSEPSNTCKFMDNGFAIFYSELTGCLMGPQEDDLGNLCYHVSTDSTKMFMS